jgi:predicted glycoside hydrolase/deacetylase ChbG (UPF0249 family)
VILVVNADDAGVDVPRNLGILRAVREGIVRSASLLVGAPAADDFVERAGSVEGLGIGLHLNLSSGLPLVRGHRSLVGEDGRFLDKREVWRRAEAGALDEREVRREVEAQWSALLALGVRPTHVDGHNHVHLLPGVREAVASILPAGLWIRCPVPLRGSGGRLSTDPFESRDALADRIEPLGLEARTTCWTKFRTASRLEGTRLPPGYSASDLVACLGSLEAAESEVVEIMTHPGETCDCSVPYSASPDRSRELAALTSAEAKSFIRERGIRLASFGGCP